MNSFGRIFRVSIFGESHGESVGIVIDGCPAGLPLTVNDFLSDLERRKGGTQKGTTPRQEEDLPIIKSGVFNEVTTGAPLAIFFENKNVRSSDYEKQRTVPRPGHADFVARKKFGGFEDYRGSGHFSGRLTVALVAAGVIAKKILSLVKTPLQKGGALASHEPYGYMTEDIRRWGSMLNFAKKNRLNPTSAEDMLWQRLRNKQLDGFKFRRQHPINGFIPDFICLDRKLMVEIDGGYHHDEEQKKFDEIRQKWLTASDFRMIRFQNEEIINDINNALEKIKIELNKELKSSNKKTLSQSAVANSPSPLERGVGGEIQIESTILEIGGETDLDYGLQKAIDNKDSIGGIVECRVTGLPVGLGEPFFDSAESVIAHLVFSIPAIRAIEFGTGFPAAGMFGSEHNDAILDTKGQTRTNHAGGIVGGLTNGNELVFRVAVKPTSSTPKEQNTLNWETGKVEDVSVKGRHDLCIALRVPVVLEAVTAIALTDLFFLEQRIPKVLQ